MVDAERKVLKEYRWRAKLPGYFRMGAVAAAGLAVVVIAIGFFTARSRSPFKLRSEHTQLSTEVTSEVNGYERVETENGVPKYAIRAEHARTFSDGHQELSQVSLDVYDEAGAVGDKLSATNALYIPEADKNFTAYLNGDVSIETRDRLSVKTGNLIYSRSNEIADADQELTFERDGIRGRSVGAKLRIGEKQIELLSSVEIETFDSVSAGQTGAYSKVSAGYASYDQARGLIEFRNDVNGHLSPAGSSETTDVRAAQAAITVAAGEVARFNSLELKGSVRITSAKAGAPPTNIEAELARYDRSNDRFELTGAVHIVSDGTETRAGHGVYERSAGKLALDGAVEVSQGRDKVAGESLQAVLGPGNRLRSAVVRGDASATKTSDVRTTTISAPELNAEFHEAGQLVNANAIGQSRFVVSPVGPASFAEITGSAARGIGLAYRNDGSLDAIRTDGRTTIDLKAPASVADAENKRLTADAVRTVFGSNGSMTRAEAAGNAELEMIPLNADAKRYRTTITSPRFDCDFFATGNDLDSCVAGKRAKAVRVPTIGAANRGTQTFSSDRMTARFEQRSGAVRTLAGSGSSKFSELDRNAIAAEMTFDQPTGAIRLRGGEPTVWDDRGRAKAHEIDIDSRSERSYLRGGVSTTYYSLSKAGKAVPFASSEKPVFVTADTAEFDHAHDNAIYRGNARGWQDDNYVRSDSLFLDQREGKMVAEGRVQSALYRSPAGDQSRARVPSYASADVLTYQRDERVLHYRNAVDIRQGPDRLTTTAADIFLAEDNELAKTVAQGSVVLTQPGRRATGDWGQFTSEDEVAIIRGDPAIVVEGDRGSTQGREMTFRLRENKLAVESRGRSGNVPGRTRSVYKVASPE